MTNLAVKQEVIPMSKFDKKQIEKDKKSSNSNKKGSKNTTKKYSKKSKEERKAEMDRVLETLEQGVKSVFTSENYINYLKFFSQFHNYSFNNVIMILMQYPTASRVASFRTWNKLGLKVKKGSKGIKVLVPIPYSYTKEEVVTDEFNNPRYDKNGKEMVEETEVKGLTFRLGNVFDISQVEGDVEIPTLAKELQDNPKQLEEAIESLIRASEVPINYDYSLSSETAYGYYDLNEKAIYLRADLNSMHLFKTLIHEKAHSMLHNKDQNKYTREEAEVQAESTAFVVCNCLGFDTSTYSFGYIASWSKNKELKELKESLKVIADTSNEILRWIEKSTDLRAVDNNLNNLDNLEEVQ